MTQELYDKLNLEIRMHFGDTPAGGPAFKWDKTSNMFYFYETDGYQEVRTESGLWVAQKVWERHCYADRYGDRWCMTVWQPPECGPSEWATMMGGAFPYPSNGTYDPIESTVLDDGVEPTEFLNRYTIRKLYEHLGMKYRDHLDDAREKADKIQKADKSMTNDMIDDVVPAYGNVPGQKLHVSFPSVSKTA